MRARQAAQTVLRNRRRLHAKMGTAGFSIVSPYFADLRGVSYRKLMWAVGEIRRWRESVALYDERQGKFLRPTVEPVCKILPKIKRKGVK